MSMRENVEDEVFKQLNKLPWAVTIPELVSTGKKHFFRSRVERKKQFSQEKMSGFYQYVRNKVIEPAVAEGKIMKMSLSHLGTIFFKIRLKGKAKKESGLENYIYTSVTRKKKITEEDLFKAEIKCISRTLLEYWDFIKRDFRNAPVSIRTLYHLSDGVIRTTSELADAEKIDAAQFHNYIRSFRIDMETKSGRPQLVIKIKREGRKNPNQWGMTPYFKAVWDNALITKTKKRWARWSKEHRRILNNWVPSTGY